MIQEKITILCPVYNDTEALNILLEEADTLFKKQGQYEISFLIVDDGSIEKIAFNKANIFSVKILHLHRNIGHQKAIAIGLAYAHHHILFNTLIIMDCDGEDDPQDIIPLLEAAALSSKIAVAQRSNRQEGKWFKLFYKFYKLFFRILTGKQISFGNFMALSKNEVTKIVHYSEIWNHLAGTIIKSKIPYHVINTNRGKRYAGQSKMNFSSLFLHGLEAIGVFIDTIAIRLLIFSLLMIAFAIAAILLIVSIRFFTQAAIPGWATSALSSMLIVLLQSFLLSLFTIFLYLSSQSQRKFIPATHYQEYTASVEQV